jgi:hypothetical protein
MTLSRRELASSASSIAVRHGAATRFLLVIPGRDEVANYDAQLRIRESIAPPTLQPDGFRVCACRRIPE